MDFRENILVVYLLDKQKIVLVKRKDIYYHMWRGGTRYITKIIDRSLGILRHFPLTAKYINILLRDKDSTELIKWSGISFFAKIISLPLGYIASLIIARWYGADAMWLYGLILTAIGIASSIAMFGMWPAIIRMLWEVRATHQTDTNRAVYKQVNVLLFITSSLVALALYLTTPYISNTIFHEPRLVLPLYITALFIPIITLKGLHIEFLKAMKDIFHAELVEKVRGSVIFVSLLVWLFFVRDTYYIPIRCYLFTNIFLLGIGRWYIHTKRTSWYKPISPFSNKKILTIWWAMFVTALSGIIISHTDIIMLGIYTDTDQVGVYKIVISLSHLVSMMMLIVGNITWPQIADKYWENDKKWLQKILHQSTLLITLWSLPLFLLLLFGSKFILSLFWPAFMTGSLALIILIIGALTHALSWCNYHYMYVTGKERYLRDILLATATINIISNIFLIPRYGIVWAAISTSATFILTNIVIAYLVWQQDKIIIHFQPSYLRRIITMKGKR